MNSDPINWIPNDSCGFVVSTSRRWITFALPDGNLYQGTAATKALDITVGDIVRIKQEGEKPLIISIEDRKNCLRRNLGNRQKLLASNLDLLIIVTAIGPLFHPTFVDRVLCAAYQEDIPTALIVNKVDLPIDSATEQAIKIYQNLSLPVLFTSTREENGLDSLYQFLHERAPHVASFIGVSGVGKSSIFNILIPEAERVTGNVSEKTGQGKQTTSQAVAERYQHPPDVDLFFIDLPGVQNFGITQLTIRDVQLGMPDIAAFAEECEFQDCQHIAEPHCAVKTALESHQLPRSRYESYIGMKEEIDRMKEY